MLQQPAGIATLPCIHYLTSWPMPAARLAGCQQQRSMGFTAMAQHNATTTTTTTTPQQAALQAAQAALQAALQGAGQGLLNLAKLQAGRAYTLRELASAIGYTIPVHPAGHAKAGKPNKAPLRKQLARAVAAGQLVTGTQGGYVNKAGTVSAGTAKYVVVRE